MHSFVPKFKKGQVIRYKQGMFHLFIMDTPDQCRHLGGPAYMCLTVGVAMPSFYTQLYLEMGDWWALSENQAKEVIHRFHAGLVKETLDNLAVDPAPIPPSVVGNIRFPQDSQVRHRKTGRVYDILITPDIGRLEATNTPAYSYRDAEGGPVWHRPQTEMEDGRFEEVA